MHDRMIPRIVVVTLAVVVVGGGAAMAFLASTQTTIPDQIDRLVTVAIGALGAILASTRGGEDPPTEVVVTNEATDPVPTTEAKKR